MIADVLAKNIMDSISRCSVTVWSNSSLTSAPKSPESSRKAGQPAPSEKPENARQNRWRVIPADIFPSHAPAGLGQSAHATGKDLNQRFFHMGFHGYHFRYGIGKFLKAFHLPRGNTDATLCHVVENKGLIVARAGGFPLHPGLHFSGCKGKC